MQPAVLIRLRPKGPWRFGPGEGGDSRLDFTFRSDRLFSAVTLAMRKLGCLEDWLDATAKASVPAVTFTSLLPFQGEVLFAPPPASLWPPASSQIVSPSPVFLAKMRWTAARFVPLTVIESLLLGQSIVADQWIPDAESACLLRRDRPSSSPFRIQTRSGAAVDRIANAAVQVSTQTCIEFESGSGLWGVARYSDSRAESVWSSRLQGAFRLLADSGFGARRSSGWGQAEAPDFERGDWPRLLFPKLSRRTANSAGSNENGSEPASYWLLSVYLPGSADAIDWTLGDYKITSRGGFVENGAFSGTQKKVVKMVVEGSVLSSGKEPVGVAVDVAPDGFPHPAYRSGFAFALKLPAAGPETPDTVEPPPGEGFGGPGEEMPPCQPAQPPEPLPELEPAPETPHTQPEQPQSEPDRQPEPREEAPADEL